MLEELLILVILEKVYLVKMCPIFVGSPLAFGARYQSFLRVCLFLHERSLILYTQVRNPTTPRMLF